MREVLHLHDLVEQEAVALEDELVSGDRKIMEAFRLYVQQSETASKDINPYLRESWHIRDALPQAISIDNFLDNQRNNEKINFLIN